MADWYDKAFVIVFERTLSVTVVEESMLLEAAADPVAAGLALWVGKSPDKLVLYDPDMMLELTSFKWYKEREKTFPDVNTNFQHLVELMQRLTHSGTLRAAIELNSFGRGPEQREVVYSGAHHGWGPTIYDLALSIWWIQPSVEISSAATNLWRRYASRRDVESRLFITTNSKRRRTDIFAREYRLKSPVALSTLEKRHMQCLANIDDPQLFLEILDRAPVELMEALYAG